MEQEVPRKFEQLWSIDQVAEYLAMSPQTLYGWRCRKYAAELQTREQGPLPT
jgi:hypothetical protein